MAQFNPGIQLPVVDEGVVVGREECAAMLAVDQMVHHGVRNGGAVEGGRTATQLVQDAQGVLG